MGNDRNRPDPLASASHLDWHGTLAKAVGPFLVRVFSERRAFRKALMVYEPLLLLSIFGVPATLNILQVATVTFTALWGRCHCHLILQRKEQAARFRPCKEVSDPGLGRAKGKICGHSPPCVAQKFLQRKAPIYRSEYTEGNTHQLFAIVINTVNDVCSLGA